MAIAPARRLTRAELSDAEDTTDRGRRLLVTASLVIAGLLVLPIATVLASAFLQDAGTWRHLASTVLPGYALNTLVLSVLVGLGTLTIGVGCAWLVTMYRFPGRGFFSWALILPLACPAYVLAYAYTDFLEHAGPVQSLLRDVTGWGPRDYWFPEIRSLEGAALMFVLVLYPYVYLLTRTALLQQSVVAHDVARALGCGPIAAMRRVVLPMARPAIVSGLAFALMETLADFGTVSFFGVQTYTTGVYRAWFSLGDRVAAGQLAAALLCFVLLLLLLERWQRGSAGYHQPGDRYEPLPQRQLEGGGATLAILCCALPLTFGFFLPIGLLLDLAAGGGHTLFGPRYIGFATNSLTLATIAAVLAVAFALLMAYGQRQAPGPLMTGAVRIAGVGYAIPGSIIAVGVLLPLSAFDNALDAWMRATLGISTGLLLTGSIFGLVFAYLARFMAVALHTVDASLTKVTLSMDGAARTLGASLAETLMRVHLPLLRPGLLTAGLIVFVDVMKELPATLLIRPFNYDTLAVQAYRLASDERLAEAATPSLTIVAVGLLPVIILSMQIARSRPGTGVMVKR